MRIDIRGMVGIPKRSASAPDGLIGHQVLKIQSDLTILPQTTSDVGKAREPLKLYVESPCHIWVPRCWYQRHRSLSHEEIINVSYGSPLSDACVRAGFVGSNAAPFDEQARATDALMIAMGARDSGSMDLPAAAFGGTILKASCAFGKTATSLRMILRLGRTALVVVNKDFFMDQWEEEIRTFLPGARIGKIQGPKLDYRDKDIVIGMIHSLAQKEYDPEVYAYFGTIIVDEAHRTGSDTFSTVVPRFSAAWRLALTATPRRKDGCERAFLENIGTIGYAATTQSSRPMVKFVNSGIIPAIRKYGRFYSVETALSVEVDNAVASNEEHNRQCIEQALRAVATDRKVMMLSTRIEQLGKFWQMLRNERLLLASQGKPFPYTIGWAVGERPEFSQTGEMQFSGEGSERKLNKVKVTKQELQSNNNCQIILSTKQMIEEGYNNQSLDTIILCVPLSDVEQIVGRIRRWCLPTPRCATRCPWRAGRCAAKPEPVVVDMCHTNPRMLKKMRYRIGFYQEIQARMHFPADGSLNVMRPIGPTIVLR